MIAKRLVLTAVVFGAIVCACAPTRAEPLPRLPPGGSLGLALGVTNVPNLRDMGGYQTRDGGEVARRLECGLGPGLLVADAGQRRVDDGGLVREGLVVSAGDA